MDYKEAIEILHPDTTAKKLIEIEYFKGFSGKAACIEAINEASVLACEAMEKQIAKKIVFYDNCGNPTPHTPRCPKCFEEPTSTWYTRGISYCEYCGQKLDWNE